MSSNRITRSRPRVDDAPNSIGRILDAAVDLVTRRGDANVSMADIARAAGVSRQAVYLHFADRAALMTAIGQHAGERIGLADDVARVAASPTGVAMVEELVAMQARANPALWPVARAADAVRRTDADAERAWQAGLEGRLSGCRTIVAKLAAEGNLRTDLEPATAAELLWILTSLHTWEDLVLQRGWSARKYRRVVTGQALAMLTGGR